MGAMRTPAVLLLSSGLDSAANLALADECGFDVRLALTLDYGQFSAKREIAHAASLSKHYSVEHMVLDLSAFGFWTGHTGGLMQKTGKDIPTPTDLDAIDVTMKTAKAVWVPNRNGVFVALAAAIAESRGMSTVLVGFNAEEAVTFPDNSVDYMRAVSESLKYSTANGVRLESPTAKLTKTEIVREISKKKFPFELLWSCYRDGDKHCGVCESCQRLKRAMQQSLNAETYETLKGRMF